MRQSAQFLVSQLILCGFLFIMTSCDLDQSSKPSRRTPYSNNSEDGGNPRPAEDPKVENKKPVDNEKMIKNIKTFALKEDRILIKNFRQISATMSVLTTIPSNHPQISAAYSKLDAQLPDTSDARSFLPAHQVAIGKLSVEYCDAMIDSPAAVTTILPAIDLSKPAFEALNPSGRELISKLLIKRFWGENLANRPDETKALQTLSQLTDQLVGNKDIKQTGLTVAVVKGLCTAVLASGPVILQ